MGLFHKAERKKARLRLGLAGPAGSGKTYSALLVAFGIGGKVALIDTENGSGELYANLGEYDVCTIAAPYTVQKYLDAMRAAEEAGYSVIIIDSLTHAWAGAGGLLDQKSAIAKRSGNEWTAWRDISPLHNQLVEALLQSPCHIIATLRSKMDYVQQKDERTGKTVVEKLGMGTIQRDGMEYEFTVMFDMAQDHTASSTKDRTSLFDGQFFKPNQDTGKTLLAWLESGVEAPAPQPAAAFAAPTPASPTPAAQQAAASPTSQPQAPAARPISDAQKGRIIKMAAQKGVSEQSLRVWARHTFNVDLEGLTNYRNGSDWAGTYVEACKTIEESDPEAFQHEVSLAAA